MLFYVQMKWNYQGRLTQDQLWDLEAKEGVHGLEGIQSGMVKGLYKVASQHRVLAIVDASSAEALDRNSMGELPMREYLEFEQVWPLRDYAGFVEDVKRRFQPAPGAPAPSAPTSPEQETREVANQWFSSLSKGDFDTALKSLARDIVWENVPSTPGVSDVAPWLGRYVGIDAVLDSFKVWGRYSKMEGATLLNLVVQGNQAVGLVHEKARCLATGNTYDLYVATYVTVSNKQIVKWQVFWDPSPLIAAYRPTHR